MWVNTVSTRRHPLLSGWVATSLAMSIGLLSGCGGGGDMNTSRSQSHADVKLLDPSNELLAAQWAKAADLNRQTLNAADSALAASGTTQEADRQKMVSTGTMRPVFRFYNPYAAVHFYTISATERDEVIRTLPAYAYEGQAFSASIEAAPGLNAVHRFVNTLNGVHFYSISAEEKTYIQNNLPAYRYEGVAYYASPVAATGFSALYRFLALAKGVHFYTASAAEAANVRLYPAGYRDEGIGYYVGPVIENTSSSPAPCETATGRVLAVGPGKPYASPGAASLAVRDGDVIRIDAGEYRGDVAFWFANNLTICGVGGRVRLYADGQNAGGKAIWVVQGSNITVANIDFHGARVNDRNGAGIRAEHTSGYLRIINSGFYDNENGILATDGPTSILIEGSEFARNGTGLPDGQSHNVYINRIDSVRVSASFFHQAKYGHNFKSRAKETVIENSYLMDGASGYSSYLVDTPNGGRVVLRGNLIQKGPLAANRTAIAYGAESIQAGINTLLASHNTIVMTRPDSTFFSAPVGTQSIQLIANLLASTNNDELIRGGFSPSQLQQTGNVLASSAEIAAPDSLVAPNFWPNPTLLSRLGLTGIPDATYTHDAPEAFRLRALVGSARLSGALQSAP